MELKTHHEQWIGDSNVKEQVAIKEKDVAELLELDGLENGGLQRYVCRFESVLILCRTLHQIN